MNNVNPTTVKHYIDTLITDAVQDDITQELEKLHQENTDIDNLMENMSQASTVKKQAVAVLAEVLIDNAFRIKALMQQVKKSSMEVLPVTTL